MATTIKRILCFGDSFCADSRLYHTGDKFYQDWTNQHWGSNQAWIDELADQLDCSVNHLGVPGTGPSDVFWQLSNFLAHNELLETDLVIITWSQYTRSLDSVGEPLQHYQDYSPINEAKMHDAAKMFFLCIYNESERFNTYNMSVNAVDNLLRNVKSKVFHFYCFYSEFARQVPEHIQSHVYQFNAPKTGHLCTAFYLSALGEKHYREGKPFETWWARPEGDEHPNHLGPLANAELTEYIKDRL